MFLHQKQITTQKKRRKIFDKNVNHVLKLKSSIQYIIMKNFTRKPLIYAHIYPSTSINLTLSNVSSLTDANWQTYLQRSHSLPLFFVFFVRALLLVITPGQSNAFLLIYSILSFFHIPPFFCHVYDIVIIDVLLLFLFLFFSRESYICIFTRGELLFQELRHLLEAVLCVYTKQQIRDHTSYIRDENV